ncbi:MAG: hypothetical protein N2V78_11165 [Methanophagales archaeon]|nr:hypothetical protein [Methanophagales archaeon]
MEPEDFNGEDLWRTLDKLYRASPEEAKEVLENAAAVDSGIRRESAGKRAEDAGEGDREGR